MFSAYDHWRLRGPDEDGCQAPDPCRCGDCREEAAWARADLAHDDAQDREP
jgi:hypothetical protein